MRAQPKGPTSARPIATRKAGSPFRTSSPATGTSRWSPYPKTNNTEIRPGEPNWKEVVLTKLRRISGTIRDREGNPLPGGMVLFHGGTSLVEPEIRLGKPDTSRYQGVAAKADGRYDTGFRVQKQPPFPAYLLAWAPGSAVLHRTLPPGAFQGLEARADFDLESEMPVSVIVTDQEGKAVEGAEVGCGDER